MYRSTKPFQTSRKSTPSRKAPSKSLHTQSKRSKIRYQIFRLGHSQQSKVYDGIFDPTSPTQPSLPPTTSPPVKLVFQHALLASKAYWTPFIRALHTQLRQHPDFQRTPIEIDCYTPDLTFHGETAVLNDPTAQFDRQFNYLTHLTSDLESFIASQVLTPDELSIARGQKQVHMNNKQPRVGIIGHSLGARVTMLFNLKHQSQIENPQIHHNPRHHDLSALFGSIPIVSLDASPATYHHDHQHLFRAMLQSQTMPLETFSSKQHLKHAMLSISPTLDDNTIAFALQNNFSSEPRNHLLANRSQNNPIASQFAPHPNYIQHKLRSGSGSHSVPTTLTHSAESVPSTPTDNCHYWISDVEALSRFEPQVHTWPISPTHYSSTSPILCIGGTESTRLTNEAHLTSLKSFFPNSKVEMIRGGHFAHQGIDQGKAAKLILEHLRDQNVLS